MEQAQEEVETARRTAIVKNHYVGHFLPYIILRSGYQSFYDMISQHRVHQHPDSRLADIAEQCGFSSQASMTKAFKSQGKESPSTYRSRPSV